MDSETSRSNEDTPGSMGRSDRKSRILQLACVVPYWDGWKLFEDFVSTDASV